MGLITISNFISIILNYLTGIFDLNIWIGYLIFILGFIYVDFLLFLYDILHSISISYIFHYFIYLQYWLIFCLSHYPLSNILFIFTYFYRFVWDGGHYLWKLDIFGSRLDGDYQGFVLWRLDIVGWLLLHVYLLYGEYTTIIWYK